MNLIHKFASGVLVFSNAAFKDSRGSFLKVYKTEISPLSDYHVRQVNYVETSEQNTLRGLHYQVNEFAESKLFRCVRGSMQLGFVDMRPGSDSFRQGDSYILDDPEKSVLLPKMFASGYLTLADQTCVLYMSDNHYSGNHEAGVRWNDPKTPIQWLVDTPRLSDKDLSWALL